MKANVIDEGYDAASFAHYLGTKKCKYSQTLF